MFLLPILLHSIFLLLYLLQTIVYASHDPPFLPGAYIIEFEHNNTEPPLFYETLRSQHGINATHRLTLSHTLFNGASFQLPLDCNHANLTTSIHAMPLVRQIWPVRLHGLPTKVIRTFGSSSSPKLAARDAVPVGFDNYVAPPVGSDTYVPHVMCGVNSLRAEDYRGRGILIGLVDTGVDYMHPSFGGGMGDGYKITTGFDLVGNAYTGLNAPVPGGKMGDCFGHGTHVAGIVGAYGVPSLYNISGVASKARLGMWKVFGCSGSVSEDVLISAFNMAFEAGVDVISASVGSNSGWGEDAWDVAVQRIVRAGVPCTLSTGNDGAFGVFDSSAAAEAVGVTAVGSVDSLIEPLLLTVAAYHNAATNTNESFAYVGGTTTGDFGTINVPLYALDFDTTKPDDACHILPWTTPDLSQAVVLIRRGGCPFDVKIANVQSFGAQRVLFYNNLPTAPFVVGALINIPVGMVSEDQGLVWISELRHGLNVTIAFEALSVANQTLETSPNIVSGGFMSSFSSWGPTYEGYVKPQISAPGGNIVSTYPVAKGSYAVLSGTSMAAPYIAAVIALIMEARGKLSPRQINSLLVTTASPLAFNDGSGPRAGYLAPIIQQGGGLVNAYAAVHAKTLLDPANIAFNDSAHFIARQRFLITNTADRQVGYNFSNKAAATVYTLSPNSNIPTPFPPELIKGCATLTFFPQSLALLPGKSAIVIVSASPPRDLSTPRIPIYSGYIHIQSSENETLHLPYTGIAAPLSTAALLDRQHGFPFLANSLDYTRPLPSTSTPTFRLSGNPAHNATSQPTVVWNLAMGSRIVRVDILPLTPNTAGLQTVLGVKCLGSLPGYPVINVPRNTVFHAAWSGRLATGGFAPQGQYRFLVRALKIMADESLGESYETVSSGVFGVEYN